LSENISISKLEAAYMKNKAGQTYIACEYLDFQWTKEEVKEFGILWREGRTLYEIARFFKRTPEEVLILALDRGMSGYIEPRRGGLIGVLDGRRKRQACQ